jgi:nucleoside-diphosphate-sugar epimerase
MRVLITGTSGFFGKIIKNELVKNEVFDLNRFSGFYQVDLSRNIPRLDKQFDLVIHVAGLAHSVPKTKVQIEQFCKVNVTGTLNLLHGLDRSFLPKMFVYISTVAVYGETNAELINEESALKAIDPYGKSKIDAEKLVLNWCEINNIICTILRLPLLVGSNPSGNLGAMIKGIRKGYYFNIAGGSANKSMVLASDVAKYLLKASENGGTFNLTDGCHPSFFELSDNISRQLGKNRPKNLPFWLAKALARIGDLFGAKAPLNSDKLCKITSDLTYDDTKAREAFGWDPTPVLKGFKISDKDQ